MSRRVSLPGADLLFRPQPEPADLPGPADDGRVEASRAPANGHGAPSPGSPGDVLPDTGAADAGTGSRRPTGRRRHDEKITVYISADELLDLERARLTLRAEHGLAVDRGRIVREAVAVLLADLDENGDESVLVRRLHRP